MWQARLQENTVGWWEPLQQGELSGQDLSWKHREGFQGGA